MSDSESPRQTLSISAVERDTGLTKDTLRVWERRYGFPKPARDVHGERVYSIDEIDKLRALKRLLDRGYRPGKIIQLPIDQLHQLSATTTPTIDTSEIPGGLRPFLDLVKAHQVPELRDALAAALAQQGLRAFILNTVAPLNYHVGLAWMRGYFEVFEEHIYTETVQGLLRHATVALPQLDAEPRILLQPCPASNISSAY